MNVSDPLITNEQLQALLSRAKGMSKTHRDTMWEALVFVRGTYERERADLLQQLAARDAEIAALKQDVERLEALVQWEPVPASLEYDLITYAIRTGEIPIEYHIMRHTPQEDSNAE